MCLVCICLLFMCTILFDSSRFHLYLTECLTMMESVVIETELRGCYYCHGCEIWLRPDQSSEHTCSKQHRRRSATQVSASNMLVVSQSTPAFFKQIQQELRWNILVLRALRWCQFCASFQKQFSQHLFPNGLLHKVRQFCSSSR